MYLLIHLILIPALGNTHYIYPHFEDEEVKVPLGKEMFEDIGFVVR